MKYDFLYRVTVGVSAHAKIQYSLATEPRYPSVTERRYLQCLHPHECGDSQGQTCKPLLAPSFARFGVCTANMNPIILAVAEAQ